MAFDTSPPYAHATPVCPLGRLSGPGKGQIVQDAHAVILSPAETTLLPLAEGLLLRLYTFATRETYPPFQASTLPPRAPKHPNAHTNRCNREPTRHAAHAAVPHAAHP
jgi:hypothetical protein